MGPTPPSRAGCRRPALAVRARPAARQASSCRCPTIGSRRCGGSRAAMTVRSRRRYCETCYASLGVVGTVGLGWLGVCALAALAGGARGSARGGCFGHASAGVAIAAVAEPSAGSRSAFEFLVTPEMRAWNRISVFIAFMSLLAVALLLDAGVAAAPRPWRGARRSRARCSRPCSLSACSSRRPPQDVPAYAADAREWHSDACFVAADRGPDAAGRGHLPASVRAVPRGLPEHAGRRRGRDVRDEVRAAARLPALYEAALELRRDQGAARRLAGAARRSAAGYLLAAASAAGFDGLWLDPAGFASARRRGSQRRCARCSGSRRCSAPTAICGSSTFARTARAWSAPIPRATQLLR